MLEEDEFWEIWRQEILYRKTWVLTLFFPPPSQDVVLVRDENLFKNPECLVFVNITLNERQQKVSRKVSLSGCFLNSARAGPEDVIGSCESPRELGPG